MTRPDENEDSLLSLIAESILDASDEEILRVARERGVNVAALQARVRRMVQTCVPNEASTDGLSTARRAFNVGDTVTLRSDPSRVGVVMKVTPSNRETRYGIFLNGRVETLYSSQLLAADLRVSAIPVLGDEFHARLTAHQLVAPSLVNLYSLQAGRIDFIPYQFRPVLKFVRADRPRLLLADEVGVGKTIEAGLLLRELQARRPLRTVLVVCSKALVIEEKWHREMRRFDEEFVTLDGKTLRYCLDQTDLDGEWPERYGRAIVPYSLFHEGTLLGAGTRDGGKAKGLLELETPPRFDLLIVDEAHNARNPETNLHQGLRVLADNAEAVVLITATPVQLRDSDLFSLLNLLRPDLVIDRPTFERMAAPNPSINGAIAAIRAGQQGWQEQAISQLDDAAQTDWGKAMLASSPEFCSARDDIVTATDDEARVRLTHRIEALHSFSSLINRTRRRDIGVFTTRKPRTEAVDFTPAQAILHGALLAAQRRVFERRHGSLPLGFLMTTIRRQASSSLHALVPFLEAILTRGMSEAELIELNGEGDTLAASTIDAVRADVASVLSLARTLPLEDPKLDRLLAIVAEKSEMPNRRLLVFSAFRHTLAYLETALLARGVRVAVIHGDVGDEDRRRLRAAFAFSPDNPAAVDILLSSEVGSEGLDFQFCDALVNYDIPWNPMRIEQRIGRIDRYGQRSETVVIYNLVTPGTVDFDIYDRCLLRIGIFERTIGASEAILGEIGSQLQGVAENLALTDDERTARLQQLADNEIRRIVETQALEEREAELFGVRLTRERIADDIAAASSAWLEPSALERLVTMHLEKTLGLGRSPLLGQGPVKTLRLSADARRRLLPGRSRKARTLPAEREWEGWLKGDQPSLAITFDREAALADRSIAFVTPVHPLVQAAAREISNDDDISVALSISDSGHPPGSYPFAIYQWQFSGLKEDAVLVPVLAESALAHDFMRLVVAARDVADAVMPSASEFDALDGWHHGVWEERRVKHVVETERIAQFRRDSLEASQRARMATLNEQLARAGEGRIRRMRSAQIGRAVAEHRDALAELARAGEKADILFRRVAVGVLVVES